MRLLAFAMGVLMLTAGSVLAAPDNSQVGSSIQKPDQEFKALDQIVAPVRLTDEQLASIEGAAPLANFHALPPNNTGTANAVQRIPADVFSGQVQPRWFGVAAGK